MPWFEICHRQPTDPASVTRDNSRGRDQAAQATWAISSATGLLHITYHFVFMLNVLGTNWGPTDRALFMQIQLVKTLLLWGTQLYQI